MTAIEPTTLGKRLSIARGRRHMSQSDLAETSGIHIGTIRKIEQGQRTGSRLSTLVALADALGISANELNGIEPGLIGVNADVAAMRTAIYDTSATAEPPALDILQQETADLRATYWHANFAVLAAQLPAHLAAARSAVRQASGEDAKREAYGILAKSLQLAASLVTHLAFEDLAHVALMEATDAAQHADDRLLLAAQHSTKAWVLSRQGLYTQAQHLAVTAARDIEPVFSEASAENIAVWGGLLHFGMAALAREGREDEAHQLLTLVQAAGEALRGRAPDVYKTPFNSTWASHSAVQLAKDLDQPRDALRAAQRVETPGELPPSVRARYLLNVAWASSLEWKSGDALRALKQVEQLTPELLSRHGLARMIVEELMPRRKTQQLHGLLSIAEKVGVIQ